MRVTKDTSIPMANATRNPIEPRKIPSAAPAEVYKTLPTVNDVRARYITSKVGKTKVNANRYEMSIRPRIK